MRFLVFSIVLALSACAPRGTITYFPGAGQIGDVQSIFPTQLPLVLSKKMFWVVTAKKQHEFSSFMKVTISQVF